MKMEMNFNFNSGILNVEFEFEIIEYKIIKFPKPNNPRISLNLLLILLSSYF